jgi:3-hydroxyisobutyrate dehydrogenase-like beta-hydroxyacid dehydrogenase
MGANFFNCGPTGMGQTAKVANNLALAIQMQSICEAMLFGEKMGIDLKVLTEIMSKATSRSTNQLLESQCRPPSARSPSNRSFVARVQERLHE